HSEVPAGRAWVLLNLEQVFDRVRIEPPALAADELLDPVVVVPVAVEVVVQLVAADVIERLVLGAVRVDLPGEKVVEAVPLERRARQQVALETIPPRIDDAAEAVHEGPEDAGRRVIQQPQIAGRRIEAPKTAGGRRLLVLVELRIEMGLAAARPVG